MKTLMIGKQKGGIGASTIVRELAVAAAQDGLRVALLDLDPQRTTAKWWNRRTRGKGGTPNPNLAEVEPSAVAGLLQRISASQDILIIDTPPSVHPYIGGMMRLADAILVPSRPTTDDLDALPPVLDLISAAGRGGAWAFCMTQGAPAKSRLVDDALTALARRGRVGPPLRWRADFPSAASTGKTTLEAVPKSKAATEVRELWRYVADDLLHISQPPSVMVSHDGNVAV